MVNANWENFMKKILLLLGSIFIFGCNDITNYSIDNKMLCQNNDYETLKYSRRSYPEKMRNDFEIAVYQKDKEFVDCLLKAGVSFQYLDVVMVLNMLLLDLDVNLKDANGQTPLIKAIEWRDYELFDILLKQKASIFLEAGFPKQSPLFLASYLGDIKIVERLLKEGAKYKKGEKDRLLCRAAYWGFADIVSLLLKNGANLEARTECGETPLLLAVINNQYDIANFLLKKGADPNKTVTPPTVRREGPMTTKDYYNAMGMWGCNDYFKKSALRISIENRNLEMVKLLLKYKANVNLNSGGERVVKDSSGMMGSNYATPKSPLEVALNLDETAIIELLYKYGAE